jgi:hypothetical protein
VHRVQREDVRASGGSWCASLTPDLPTHRIMPRPKTAKRQHRKSALGRLGPTSGQRQRQSSVQRSLRERWMSDRLQALPIMLRIWAMICQAWSGSPKNLLQGGGSVLGGFDCPDTAMILIAGQRLCTVCARPRPSILPGN